MKGDASYVFLGFAIALLIATVVYISHDLGQVDIKRSCENHRIFVYDGEVYTCRHMGGVK
jgi:hypothetical protein